MKKIMFKQGCPNVPQGYNKGEAIEWKVGYTLQGTPNARNNRPAASGGDVGEWQVKSPKASLSNNDNCGGYIFAFADSDYFYQMSKQEFESFVNEFSYQDYDSHTHKAKLRIKNDSKKMREWFERG